MSESDWECIYRERLRAFTFYGRFYVFVFEYKREYRHRVQLIVPRCTKVSEERERNR